MRLTVGPLPPAVYWRRRALVLGAILVVILLIAYSCSIGPDDGRNGAQRSPTAGTGAPTDGPSGLSPSEPSPSELSPSPASPETTGSGSAAPGSPGAGTDSTGAPGTGVVGAGAEADGGGGGANGGADGGATGAAAGGPCTDTEIAVVATAESATVRQGVPTRLFIRIKNISSRTCVRDVGAHMQELFMRQGSTIQWSSDSCEKRVGNDVVTFPPNHEVAYWSTWDGKSTAKGCTNRPWMAIGTYQLFGRLGTKLSEPATFTITG